MEKILSKLTIKVFHIDEAAIGDQNTVNVQGKLTVCPVWHTENDFIDSISVKIIEPDKKDVFTHSIMDVIPISTKVLGKLGEGITHTLSGVCVILTGVDVNGVECAEFGSSEGILSKQMIFDKAGTPRSDDYIISFDVVFKDKMGQNRQAVYEAHRQCDMFIDEFRALMKGFKGELCTERHDFTDKQDDSKIPVVMIRQVAGQGAMYDTYVFPKEPFGAQGGMSIIDINCMPVVLTPNEYRDGALRSMQ